MLWVAIVIIATPFSAFAQYAPKSLNISGGLFLPSGLPVTSTSVDFRLEIWDKGATCKLYEETHSAQNLSGSKGGFSLQLGEGTAVTNFVSGGPDLTWQVFANPGAPNTVVTGCVGGVLLLPGDDRLIRVYYNLGSGMTAMTPDVPIESSAYAMIADTIQGRTLADLIVVRDDVGTDLTQSNVENVFSASNYAKLVQLLTNTLAAPYSFNNQTITNVGTPSAGGDAVNKTYADSRLAGNLVNTTGVANGNTLIWNGSAWLVGTPSAVDATKLPLAGGTMTGPVTYGGFDLYNTGHITMGNQRTLMLGHFTNAQEGGLGLGVGDEGRMFYNTELDALRLWNGAAFVGFGASGVAGGDLTGTYPNPTINVGTVTTAKIATDAITSEKLDNAGMGINRLVISDGTDPNLLRFKTCALNQILQWGATGWGCVDVGAALPNTGIAAGMYGSSTTVSRIGLNAQGVVTSAASVAIDFPVVSVNGKTGVVVLNGADLGLGTASLEDVGNGALEVPMTDAGGKLNPSVIPTLGIGDISGAITSIVASSPITGGGSSGVVTIGLDASQVDAAMIRGNTILAGVPADNQVLTWNNSAARWEARTPGAGADDLGSHVATQNIELGAFWLSGDGQDEGVFVDGSGRVGVGTDTPNVNAIMDINGLAGLSALLVPRDSQAARPVGVNGMIRYNTNTAKMEVFENGGWTDVVQTPDGGILNLSGTNGALVSGPALTKTISIDTGVTTGQIVQVAAGDRLPVIDGSNLTGISNLRGVNVSTTAPTVGQVLRHNGSAWEAFTPVDNAGVTLVAMGTGMLGGNISATGTLTIDVGTGPNQIVQLDGTSRLPAVNGSQLTNVNAVQIQSRDVAAGLPADNQVLTWNNAAAQWEARTPGAGADNLGSHIAGQHIQLNGFFLSGDGGAEGVFVAGAGNVGVGTSTPNANSILDVNGSGAMSAMIVPRDDQAARPAGVNGMIRYNTNTARMEIFENGGWTNVVQVGDGGITALSGDVTASGSGSVTATIRNDRITTAMMQSTGGGVNRLLITDGTTGGAITFADACADNEVLKWNTSLGWGCAADVDTDSGVVTLVGANGALVSGPALTKTISIDTGVTTGQIVQVAAGDRLPVIDGSNLTNIANLRGVNVSTTAPTVGQVLRHNGSAWEAFTPVDNAGVTFVAMGSGMLGGNITSTGTLTLDVGTGPNQIVQLDGTSRLPGVNGSQLTNVNAVQLQSNNVLAGVPADNQVLTWNNSASRWEARSPGAGADNLGSHIAAQHIQLNGFFLSGDGGAEGVFVAGVGNVGVGTNTPNANSILDVNGSGAMSALIVPRDSQAARPTGVNGMIRYNTNTAKMEIFENGGWTDVVQTFTDTDTGIVTLAGENGLVVSGPTTVKTLSIDTGVTDGQIVQVAAGDRLPVIDGSNLTDISNLRGVNVSTTAPTVGQVLRHNGSAWEAFTPVDNAGVTFVAMGSGLIGGNITATGTVTVDVGIGANQIPQLNANGFLGIGTATVTPGAVADFWGASNLDSAVVLPRATTANRPTTGVDGMIRYNTTLAKFEVYENGNWYNMATGTGADNLGNHIATANVQLGNNWLGFDGTNGEGIRIDTNGNVGIGTATPAEMLHVYGTGDTEIVLQNSSLLTAIRNQSNNLNFQIGNIEAITIRDTGSVGIGSTSPNAGSILDLNGTGNLSSLLLPRGSTAERAAAAANGMIRYNTNISRFEVYEAGQWASMATSATGGADNLGNHTATQNLRLGANWLNNDGDSGEGLRVNTDGSIEVASNNSSVFKKVETEFVILPQYANDTTGHVELQAWDNTGTTGARNLALQVAGGNVGVGTANPGALIDAYSSSSGIKLRLSDEAAPDAGASAGVNYMEFYGAGARSGYVGWPFGSLDMGIVNQLNGGIRFYSNNAESMRISNSGIVGIGTVSPNAGSILDLNGTGNLSSVLVPRGTTAERAAAAANGMLRYNTNISQFEVYQNNNWATVSTSASAGDNLGNHTATTAILAINGTAATPSYTFANDPNTGIYSAGADRLAFSTNGAERVRITSGGSVGIGTNNPQASLHLASAGTPTGARFDSDSASGTYNASAATPILLKNVVGGTGNFAYVGFADGGDRPQGGFGVMYQAAANFGSDMFIEPRDVANPRSFVVKNNGRIAMGTTSPNAGAVLDIYGTGNLSSLLIPRGTTAERAATAANGMIRYNTNLAAFEVYANDQWATMSTSASAGDNLGNHTATSAILATTGTAATPSYTFAGDPNTGIWSAGPDRMAFSTNGNERMRITNNGRVGIGSLSPSEMLDVAGNIFAQPDGVGLGIFIGVDSGGNRGIMQTANWPMRLGNESWNDTYLVTGGVEVMSLMYGGRVGIGTTSPNAQTIFEINGTGNMTNMIIPRGTTAQRAATPANGMIRYNTNTTAFEVYAGSWQTMATSATSGATDIDGLSDAIYNSTATSLYMGSGAGGGQTNARSGNTAIGYQTLASMNNDSADSNTAVGTQALNSLTSANENTAVGRNALRLLTTGNSNTAVGINVLENLVSGDGNVAMGRYAMYYSTSAASNVALGEGAAQAVTTGGSNVAVGYQALFGNIGAPITGGSNVAVGRSALSALEGGSGGNIALGYGAGTALTSGSNNIFVGVAAGDNITSGNGNLVIGQNIDAPSATGSNQMSIGNMIFGTGITGTGTTVSPGRIGIASNAPQAVLDVVGTGSASALIVPRDTTAARAGVGVNGMIRYNSATSKFEVYAISWQDLAMGSSAGATNIDGLSDAIYQSGDFSLYMGTNAGEAAATGDGNVAVGYNSMNNVTTGFDSAAMGRGALATMTDGQYNVAIGSYALEDANGSLGNTAIGYAALLNVTGGDYNTATGETVAPNLTTGHNNSAYGSGAFHSNVGGDLNAVFGANAMTSATFTGTNSRNTAMGAMSFTGVTNGSNDNTLIGYNAGSTITTGDYNLVVGTNATVPTATASGQMSIGNMIYGVNIMGSGSTISSGRIGIGSNAPQLGAVLDVVGTGDLSSMIVPRGTTVERAAAGINGMIRYNTNISAFEVYAGSWQTMATSSSGDNLGNHTATTAILAINGTAATPSYTFAGDPNTGLYSAGADQLAFATNGNHRMRIDSTGDVGIGTVNPTSELHVFKTQTAPTQIKVENQSGGSNAWAEFVAETDSGWLSMAAGGTNYGYNSISTSNHPLNFSTGGSNRMAIDATGGVAIGTYALDVILANYNPPVDGLIVSGRAGIGTTSPNVGAILDLNGTGNLSSLLVPRGTTAQRAAVPANGMIRYNSNLTAFEVYAGSWQTMATSASGDNLGNHTATTAILAVTGTAATPSYTFAGDPNTGMWNSAADNISWSTGGVERMNLDSAGNLWVNNHASIDGDVRGPVGLLAGARAAVGLDRDADILWSSTTNYYGAADLGMSRSAAGVAEINNGTVGTLRDLRLRAINPAGSVLGIGTSSPNVGAILDLNGTGNLSSLLVPRGTTAQRAAVPANGMIRYNTNTAKFEVYETQWKDMVASGGGATNIDGLSDGRTDYVTDYNLFMGSTAGNAIAAGGQHNTAVGVNAATSLTTGDRNTGFGFQAINQITTATDNTALGYLAMGNGAVTGSENVAVGSGAMYWGIAGSYNVAVGNSAIGNGATGSENTAVGHGAMNGISSGTGNTSLGRSAGTSVSTGNGNVAIGKNALLTNTTGSDNLMLGSGAGQLFTGSNNIFAGTLAGYNQTAGSNNILIGHSIDLPSLTGSNQMSIGNMIFGLGMNGSGQTIAGGRIGIGSASPSLGAVLDVVGTGNLSSMIVPRGTTAQRAAVPINGMIRYNSNISAFEVYQSSWQTLATSSTGDNLGNHTATQQILSTLGTAGTPGIAFVGDPNTGMYSAGADVLAFATNGAERIRVNSSGDVGIGTSSIGSRLDVTDGAAAGFGSWIANFKSSSGSTRLAIVDEDSGGSRPGGILADSGLGMGIYSTNVIGSIRLYTNGLNERMRIEANGNVGIGTTTPAAGSILDVNGTGVNFSSLVLPRGTTAERAVAAANGMIRYNTNLSQFEVYQNNAWAQVSTSASAGDNLGNHTATSAIFAINGTAATPSYTFAADTNTGIYSAGADQIAIATNGAERVRVNNNGYVGIGTSDPTEPLTVRRDADGATDTLTLANLSTNVGTWPTSSLIFRGTTGQAARVQGGWAGNTNMGFLTFHGSYLGSMRENARIYAGGTTYLGNTDYVGGNSHINLMNESSAGNAVQDTLSLYARDSNSAASSGIGNRLSFMAETDSDNTYAQAGAIEAVLDDASNNSKDGSLRFLTLGPDLSSGSTTATEKMRVNSYGQVGIGTATPNVGSILDVNGTGNLSSLLVPRGTTVERAATAANGMIRYNTNLAAFEVYGNNTWQQLATSATSGATDIDGLNDAIYNSTALSLYIGALSGTGQANTYQSNLALGYDALSSMNNATADNNVAIGNEALKFTTSGASNIAVGGWTLRNNTTANGNTGVGHNALSTTSTGGENTGVGLYALYATTGAQNTTSGHEAGNFVGSGWGNSAFGKSAMKSNFGNQLSGSGNSAFGTQALELVEGAAANNIGIGRQAGDNITTGSKNIIIGTDIDAPLATGDNQMSLGNIIFGTGVSGTGTTIAGNIGIGTANPTTGARLDIFGTGAANSSIIVPRDTTANRPVGTNGMIRYNTNLSQFEVYQNNAWAQVSTSASAGDNLGNHTATSAILAINGTAATPSYTFAADTNTGIYSAGADQLAIATNGAERVRVNASGSVGIGTNNPAEKLEVVGTGYVRSKVSATGPSGDRAEHYLETTSLVGNLQALENGASSLLNLQVVTNHDLTFSTNNTEKARIMANGRVGFGTTTPNAGSILDLNGTGNLSSLLVPRGTTAQRAAVPANGMIRYNSATSKFEVYAITWQDLAMGSGSASQWTTVAGNEIHYSTANVGIGTSNPASTLDVLGNFNLDTTRTDTAGGWVDTNVVTLTANPAGASTSDFHAFSIHAQSSGTQTKEAVTGNFSRLSTQGSGTVNFGRNFLGFGSVTSGNVNNFSNFVGDLDVAAGRTIGTYAQFHAGTPTSVAGTITNSYGVFIEDQLGTNQYGIYQAAANDKNYFNGSVGIGTNNPNYLLHLISADNSGSINLTNSSSNGAWVMINASHTTNSSRFGGINFLNNNASQFSMGLRDGDGKLHIHNGATSVMTVTSPGSIGIGTITPNVGSILDLNGTGNLSSVLVPRGTTAQRAAASTNGMLRYNSNSNQFEGFAAGGWAPIVRARSASGTSGAIDWSTAASQTTSFNCATDITFQNLVDGAAYTLVVTDGGTTQCNFSTTTTGADAATVNYRFNPTNGPRATTSHTVYSIQRIGTTVYISWISGF